MSDRPPPLPALPKAWVYLTDPADGADPIQVTMRQQDMIAWEETAAKHKWPTMQAAPTTFVTFTAWHALRRMGKLPADLASWEAFKDGVYGVAPEDGGEPVDPTPPAPITG